MSFYEVYVDLPDNELLMVNSDLFGLGEWRNWLDDQPPKGTMGYLDDKAVKGAALLEKLKERLGGEGEGDRAAAERDGAGAHRGGRWARGEGGTARTICSRPPCRRAARHG